MPASPAQPIADRPAEPGDAASDDPLSSNEPDASNGIDVDVDPALTLPAGEVAWLADRLAAAVAHLGLGDARIGLALLADAEMTRLHEAYKQQPGPTDVLTFDLREPDAADGPLDGDIAIGWQEAERRANELGHPARHEALLYAVHGLMHLIGEDDATPEQAERMHRREDGVLEAIGVGAVYRRDGGAS
ncbi:MAG: rRNA maturation RNase YbeY [Planctomycetota bacterium]